MDKPMENTFIIVHAWMRSELDLNSNELLVYAAIYGFCQDRKSHFLGGRSYLAAWTGTTKRSVQNNLNSLLKKGLIAKEEKVPPYIVFSDKTLTHMCVVKPASQSEMMTVSGVGEHKYKKYGEAFLACIRQELGTD